ncbi:DNA repair protein rad9 [Coniochaeta hoffmannii]|uniref:DNA repair protein rad9 n=1 Tax=Coniochaeta hoffmannii TaxID=91930 RepID=A0AA38W1K4_9PEZI|nr:DNA repair protein rad9 [Coniochaeta hoffmannii]
MAILSFTLSEEGVAVLHDALACIVKFSDDVCLEASKDKLTLTALNLSKSAYVKITLSANRFFSRYSFDGTGQFRDKFFCQLYIRSLLSIFRTRAASGDQARDRDKETTIERCDVSVDDGPGVKSRLIAKIICRNGITATHALPFETKAPVHAKFDSNEAANRWTISARTLRQLMDHFGPGIELLDINTDGENVVNFTCFTEKAVNPSTDAVLKKPLHTSIAVEMDEFDDIEVPEKLHIIVSVKDFRNILHHAQLTSGELAASYSVPGRPMKLSYRGDGILCEYILMTVGEKDAAGQRGTKRTRGANQTKPAAPRPELEAASVTSSNQANFAVPSGSRAAAGNATAQQKTPARPRQSQFQIRPPPLPPPSTLRSESLFVAQDEDQQWEPVNADEDADGEEIARLEWDNNLNPSPKRIISHAAQATPRSEDIDKMLDSGLEPTQRLSEVRRFGLFSP